LVNLLRGQAFPKDIACCLLLNIQSLQGRGILQYLAIDETDVMSLGLQSLFGHRAGKPGPKHPLKKMSSGAKRCLTRLQEPQPLHGPLENHDQSAHCSPVLQQNCKGETYDGLLSPTTNISPMSLATGSDSITLPSEDTCQSICDISPYTTTGNIFLPVRDTDYSNGEFQCYTPHYLHSFDEVAALKQWPNSNSATWPIAPQFTFTEHRRADEFCTAQHLNGLIKTEHGPPCDFAGYGACY